MAFVPGLSKKQVVKVINDYAMIAPATMQLITNLSAQINNPSDPAAALIGQMATIQNSFNSLYAQVQGLQSGGAGIADNAVSTSKIQDGAVTSNKIQDGSVTNSKLQNSSITINGSSVSLGGSLQIAGGGGGDSLPSQSGNAGKYLKTDGTTASWATVSAASSSLSSKNPTFTVFETQELASFYIYSWAPNAVNISKMGGSLSGQIIVSAYDTGVSNFVSTMQNSTMYFKKLKVPKYWITKEQPGMDLEYVYVDFSSVFPMQEYDPYMGQWFTNKYEIRFNDWDYAQYTVTENYSVADMYNLSGKITGYYYLNSRTIDYELAYLDGATSNIQTQINSIKKDGVLEAPTINAIDYEQLGNPGSSQYWDGSTQGTFGINLNNYPENPSYIDFNESSYNSLDDWFFSIYANMNLSLNEYYIRCEGSYFGTPVFAKIKSITGARVFVEYTDSRYFYDYQTAQPATFTIFTKIVTPISSSEIKALDGITSNIQGQLDAMSDIVDTVPTTVTNTIAQELGSIFIAPTIKKPTVWTESQSGEAFYANDEFRVQGQADKIEIYSSSNPSLGMNYAALELASTYYGAIRQDYQNVYVNDVEIEISGVTGTNADLINGIHSGKLQAQLNQTMPSWFSFRFGDNLWSSSTNWSNAKIKWGNIRTITSTELKSLDNINGNIQNQINAIKDNGVFNYPTIKFGEGFRLTRNAIPESNISPSSYFDGTNDVFRFYIYLDTANPVAAKLKEEILSLAKSSGNIEDYMGSDQPYTSAEIVISGVTGGDPNINGTHSAVIKNLYGNPLSYEIAFTGAQWQYDPNWNPLSDISNMVITCGNTIKITQPELEALDGVTGNIQAQLDYIMSLINP